MESMESEALTETIRHLLKIGYNKAELAALLRAEADKLEAPKPQTPTALRGVRRHTNGRKASRYVVVERRPNKLEVRIGKELWRDLGCPPRLDVQKSGRNVLLIAVYQGGEGFAVSGPPLSMPRMSCREAEHLLPPDGRYDAEMVGGTKLILRERLD